MKKLFILLLAITTTYSNAYSQSGRGKIVAAADAAGALVGAGSVASIAGWFSWTPAAPVAALAVCVGAVIGGVGASAAVSKSAPTSNPKDVVKSDIAVSENFVDKVGELHNQILYDYFKTNETYTPVDFYEFINKNKSDYGIKEINLTLDFLEQQYLKVKEFTTVENVDIYIINNLPSKADKNRYRSFLTALNKIDDKTKAIEFIKNFEKSELANNNYDEKTKGILGSFFSTYRYSYALWN